MQLSGTLRGSVVALCAVLLAVCGCSSHRQKALQKQTPEQLFKTAKKDLANNNFNGAIKAYESLTARFPFTDEARQARIDLIYAYYRAGEKESATDAADAFIRENPAHPRVDYAYYMKGMVDFERSPNAIERIFHADLTQRPPTDARKSFASFKIVVEQYPKSEYAHDALQRMVYLRDRLASYDVHVARYYLKRGAYVAAAQRARGVVDQYESAPAVKDALAIMIECYDKLGLEPLAAQSRQVYAANFSAEVREYAAVAKRSWWKFW